MCYVALQSSKRENDCLNIIKALCWMRHLGWIHALCIKISKMYVWDKVEGAPNVRLKQENRKAQSWVQNSKPFHPHGWDSLNRAQLSNHQRIWRAVVWLFTAADMWQCSDHLDQQSGIQVFCGKRFMGLSLCGKVGNGNLKGGGSLLCFPSLWETVNVQRSRFGLDTGFEQKQKKQKPSQGFVMKKMRQHFKKAQLFYDIYNFRSQLTRLWNLYYRTWDNIEHASYVGGGEAFGAPCM